MNETASQLVATVVSLLAVYLLYRLPVIWAHLLVRGLWTWFARSHGLRAEFSRPGLWYFVTPIYAGPDALDRVKGTYRGRNLVLRYNHKLIVSRYSRGSTTTVLEVQSLCPAPGKLSVGIRWLGSRRARIWAKEAWFDRLMSVRSKPQAFAADLLAGRRRLRRRLAFTIFCYSSARISISLRGKVSMHLDSPFVTRGQLQRASDLLSDLAAAVEEMQSP